MIFQDPLSSLHPFYRIGDQLVEAVQAHHNVSKAAALDKAVELLRLVGIPEPQGPRRRLPARVLRRHAPARDDRDGAHQRAEAADRRRADDGARRDRPGADPRADRSGCRRSSTPRSSSSPTTSAWWPRWPTTSPSCTRAGSSSTATDGDDLRRARSTPTPGVCWARSRSLDASRDEPLVPISGRPPSLINLPSGCSFHPRCPYVREAHKKRRADARAGRRGHRPPRRLPARRRACGGGSGTTCARASGPRRRAPT